MFGDPSASTTVRLPQDALENILLRLQASDLRRFRRVCKEWHAMISDPTFIKAHMVRGPTAPTHTIVFVPSSKQHTNTGFLFDERWRLTARFTVGASEVMIGTCNGLLCFHDIPEKIIKIVEPFTGEAIALPEPAHSFWHWRPEGYCFGFDASARQYKIVHRGISYNPVTGDRENGLRVFTVGADKDWRTLSVPQTNRCSDMACNGRAVYWSYNEYEDNVPMFLCFDLATEEITSVECGLVNGGPIFCHHPWWERGPPCIIRIRWLSGESDNGYWPRNMNAMAFDADGLNLPGRRLPRPHVLQRGHLLLQEPNGALYAHKIVSRNIHELELGYEKLLIEIGIGVEEEKPAKSLMSGRQFVRVHGSPQSRTPRVATDRSYSISTFAYVPTVSPALLALYLGSNMTRALALCVPPGETKLHNPKQE